MAATIQAIADAMVTALNAGSWSQSFTASRGWRKSYRLLDLSTIRVTVGPRSRVNVRDTRSHDLNTHTFDVSIVKRVTASNAVTRETELDALVALAEEVADFFARRAFSVSGVSMPTVSPIQIDPVCELESLDNTSVFVSVISVSVLERRDHT